MKTPKKNLKMNKIKKLFGALNDKPKVTLLGIILLFKSM
jgi:hypothetical protein